MYAHLKELRESLGMTQEEFGKSIGIAKSTYNNYETGVRDPKSDFWVAVATKYRVTIDYLMGYSDDPHRTTSEDKATVDIPVEVSFTESMGGRIQATTLVRINAALGRMNEMGLEKVADYAEDILHRYQVAATPESTPAKDTTSPADTSGTPPDGK